MMYVTVSMNKVGREHIVTILAAQVASIWTALEEVKRLYLSGLGLHDPCIVTRVVLNDYFFDSKIVLRFI